MFDPNSYFKDLAERHQDILHSTDNPSFFVEHSNMNMVLKQSEFHDRLRLADGFCVISQFNGSEDVLGNSINNANATVSGTLYFLKKEAQKDYENIEQAQRDLVLLWQDFRTEIHKQMRTDATFPRFYLQRVSLKTMGVIINGFVGIMVMMTYAEARCYTDRGKFNF